MRWVEINEQHGSSIERYLRGEFFHGTSRPNLDFRDGIPAFLTQDFAIAADYAERDAEIENEVPHVLRCRLHCTKAWTMEHQVMQDLHLDEHTDFVQDLLRRGYDCVLGQTGIDEICVIDSSKIEILEFIKLRDQDDESTDGKFVSNDTGPKFTLSENIC